MKTIQTGLILLNIFNKISYWQVQLNNDRILTINNLVYFSTNIQYLSL